MLKASPAMEGLDDKLQEGYGCPSEECTDLNPVPVAVDTPCVTSTTYIWQEPPRTLAGPIPTTHSEEPAPAPPMPAFVPTAAACEGAYCEAPEQTPTPLPNSVPECKGYDCPVPEADLTNQTPTCSGVDCPEHDYPAYEEPEPIVPQDSSCGGYSCVEEELEDPYDGGDDLNFDSEEFDEEWDLDEDFHSHLVDVDLDMETGEVQVNVNVSKVFS